MTADLTTRSLVLDMNRAYFVLDKLLYQIANVMFPTVPRISVRDDHRRAEFNCGSLFSLHRRHSHAVGSLHFILMQQGTHPRAAFLGNPVQGVIRQIGARVLRIGAPRGSGPSSQIENLDSFHDSSHCPGGRERTVGDFLQFLSE